MVTDFDSMLAYVDQIIQLSVEDSGDVKEQEDYYLNTVVRKDVVTNEGGEYSDDIKKQFPEEQDGYLKVKQIL